MNTNNVIRDLRKLGVLLGCLMLSSVSYAGQNPAIASLQLRLLPVKTMSANFQQRFFSAEGKVLQTAKGKLLFKKPGKFVWEILQPSVTQVISDGSRLWNYDSDLEQVMVSDAEHNLEHAPISVILAEDLSFIEDSFQVTQANADEYKLFPKQPHPLQEAVMRFKGKELVQLQLVDQLGQTARFDFENIRLNPDLDDLQFKFTPPPNVDVIRSIQ